MSNNTIIEVMRLYVSLYLVQIEWGLNPPQFYKKYSMGKYNKQEERKKMHHNHEKIIVKLNLKCR